MIGRFKPKSEFSRNVLTLMTGTTIAQAIPIAISPILTRIYSPEDFGIFALYVSIASIVSVVATGRYEQAIMLPKKDEDAFSLTIISVVISFLVSSITLFVVWFFNDSITKLLGNPEISNWLYFIPFTVLFTGIYQSFNNWNNRKKKYKRLAVSKVAQSGSIATSNISMGYLGFGSSGLIFSSIFGLMVAMMVFVTKAWSEDVDKLDQVKKLKVFSLMKSYKNFPIYNAQHALINVAFSQMPVFILSKYFSSTVVGFYSLSIRIIQSPIAILGSSLAATLYEKIVSLKNNKQKYMFHIYRFLKFQVLMSMLLFTLIYFVSNYMDVIFGEAWKEVGLYIKLLIPWLVMVFIVSPLAFAINMTNNQKAGLKLEWLYGAIKLGSLLIGSIYFNDIKMTLGLYSIACSIFLFIQGLWFINLLKEMENK